MAFPHLPNEIALQIAGEAAGVDNPYKIRGVDKDWHRDLSTIDPIFWEGVTHSRFEYVNLNRLGRLDRDLAILSNPEVARHIRILRYYPTEWDEPCILPSTFDPQNFLDKFTKLLRDCHNLVSLVIGAPNGRAQNDEICKKRWETFDMFVLATRQVLSDTSMLHLRRLSLQSRNMTDCKALWGNAYSWTDTFKRNCGRLNEIVIGANFKWTSASALADAESFQRWLTLCGNISQLSLQFMFKRVLSSSGYAAPSDQPQIAQFGVLQNLTRLDLWRVPVGDSLSLFLGARQNRGLQRIVLQECLLHEEVDRWDMVFRVCERLPLKAFFAKYLTYPARDLPWPWPRKCGGIDICSPYPEDGIAYKNLACLLYQRTAFLDWLESGEESPRDQIALCDGTHNEGCLTEIDLATCVEGSN